MSNEVLKRVNWYDGQRVDEPDFDTEQTAWHSGLAEITDHVSGSGIEKEFATQPVLFDSDTVPASIQSLFDTINFDGEPIYPTDSFGNTIYSQPSDTVEGDQLEITIFDADLDGAAVLKVYIFGTIFGDKFVQEVLTFEQNESQVTRNYFNHIVAFMTQDYKGNQNTIVTGIACRNAGGRLKISEAVQMTVVRDVIMAEQSHEPNMDYFQFKPATLAKTLNTLLNEIASSDSLSAADLDIDLFAATTTRLLPNNDSSGLIVGEKFKATTNNIQKVQLLLSVQENTLATPGEEFNWSGDIVVGIRKLQTTTTCPTDIIPGNAIEFDPEPSTLAEVSFDQDGLSNLGISLNDTPQIVDFVFTQSLLANPNVEPSIIVGDFYIVTIRRSGNISTGVIVLQEAANTTSNPTETDEMRMSVFSTNKWIDVPESDMWFKVYTDAIRITNGIAFDEGIRLVSPKIKKDLVTGNDNPFIEGFHSLIDVSFSTKNYIIVQKSIDLTDIEPHPATGNPIAARMEDVPDISVVSFGDLTSLIDAGNKTVILGSIKDTNPVSNPTITDTTDFPGLVRENTFTIIQPISDILLNNLVGSIITPNIGQPTLKYRIIKVENFTDAYGDVNGDGEIDLNDVIRAQELDGYAKDLMSGSIPTLVQQFAIESGVVTMEEILRADVTNDGIIDVSDPSGIQQHIVLGSSFVAGATFKRSVLTVETLVDPLSTTADIIGLDISFNTVPFTPIVYRIDFVALWAPSNLVVEDLRRFVPKTFVELISSDLIQTIPNGGKDILFIPGDVIVGGQILDAVKDPYRIDLEVNTVVINLPEGSTQGEIDVFGNFIKKLMYFSDGTLVQSSALDDNQIKVVAAIQSVTKDIDGDDLGIIDGNDPITQTISVLYTQSSGILRIRANNIRNISTRPELTTKIVLSVYLKKAGFRNTDVSVTQTQVTDLLIPL